MQDGAIVFFRYVRREDVPRYLEVGWIVCQLGGRSHHDFYAVVMEWTGIGEPPEMGAWRSGLDVAGAGPDRPSAD